MALVNGFVWTEEFLQRVGFAVGAFEYFVALESDSLSGSMSFEVLWPSILAASIHIERARSDELEKIGYEYLKLYHSYIFSRSTSDLVLDTSLDEQCFDFVSSDSA